MQGDSGRLGLAWVTAEAGSIDSHIAPRTGEPAQPSGDLLLDSPGGARTVTTRELIVRQKSLDRFCKNAARTISAAHSHDLSFLPSELDPSKKT